MDDNIWSPSSRRAWIEIQKNLWINVADLASPSSRRAWIEIFCTTAIFEVVVSPSSRRAWIEICLARRAARRRWVALLAEGVDRNTYGYSM